MFVNIPERATNFMRRIVGLRPGRYEIVLTVLPDGMDYTVKREGAVMHKSSLDCLRPGRYSAIITVDENNISDYSIIRLGKSEK